MRKNDTQRPCTWPKKILRHDLNEEIDSKPAYIFLSKLTYVFHLESAFHLTFHLAFHVQTITFPLMFHLFHIILKKNLRPAARVHARPDRQKIFFS